MFSITHEALLFNSLEVNTDINFQIRVGRERSGIVLEINGVRTHRTSAEQWGNLRSERVQNTCDK